MFHEAVERSARWSRSSFQTALVAEKHWLSNQGALEEERRKEEVFVERTASRISRKELLKTVRRKIGVRERESKEY